MIWSSEMLYDEARENYLENMRAITENKDYQLTDEVCWQCCYQKIERHFFCLAIALNRQTQ